MANINQFIDIKTLQMDNLPKDTTISTISSTCKLGTNIHIENIYNLMDLSYNNSDVEIIKYGDKMRTPDGIFELKKKTTKRKHFYNQTTIVVNLINGKKINMKLFKNGSAQMTGCKNVEDYNTLFDIVINKLKKVKAIMKDGIISEKKFINDDTKINVTNFKIDMINSNFNVNYMINREKLYKILLSQKTQCRYEPCTHACVNIKYQPPLTDVKVSVFVFEKGSIIITGAKNSNQIEYAHNYITDILAKYKDDVMKKETIDILDDFLKQLEDNVKENSEIKKTVAYNSA